MADGHEQNGAQRRVPSVAAGGRRLSDESSGSRPSGSPLGRSQSDNFPRGHEGSNGVAHEPSTPNVFESKTSSRLVTRNALTNQDPWVAVDEADIDTIRAVLKRGFDLAEKNAQGRTLIHQAALFASDQHLAVLQLLLQHSPTASNYQGYAGETALHLAAANLNLDGVRVLLGAGALVNVLDDKGQTPLDIEPAIRNVMLDNIRKPPKWIEDHKVSECQICHDRFSVVLRRHHCRHCGRVLCGKCTKHSTPIIKFDIRERVRVCVQCYLVIV